MKYLPICLPTISALDYPETEVIAIDDASSDETVNFIKKNYPQFRLISREENRGLVASFNEGFSVSRGKYVFFVNQDTVHSSDYLKKCVNVMENNTEIASVTGKVCKFDFEECKRTDIIDSVGLIMLKNRRVLDIGQGEKDIGQYELGREVFGVSGQNPVYRRVALEDILIPITQKDSETVVELFDSDFVWYKEEVDLAWRLKLAGWRAWCEPRALAWHGRGTLAVSRNTSMQIFSMRKKMTNSQKYHSLKNRYLMMLKNEIFSIWFSHLPIIIFYEILYFGYNLFFDFRIMGAYFETIKKIPIMLAKRKHIMRNIKVDKKQIRKWFV